MTRFLRTVLLTVLALISVRAEAYQPQWAEVLMQPMVGSRIFHHADFNSDGLPDFLTHSSTRLELATSNIGGWLEPLVLVYTGSTISDTTTADVTGDGEVDLIVADMGTNTITVLPSNGDGTFGTPIVNSLTIVPSQFARGDFNSDGKLDLAVRSFAAALLLVYTGDDTGHFTELSRTSTAENIYRITGGDIDGDGKTDVLLSNNGSWQHQAYFGLGDGTFGSPVSVTAPMVLPLDLKLADLDGDGDLEILSCEFRPNTLTVFRNNGSRAFAAYDTYPVISSGSGNPISIAVGDFSGDGDADVAIALVNAKTIATLEGNGNGTFGLPSYALVPQPDIYVNGPFFMRGIAAVEATGDGRLDLIMSGDRFVGLFANVSGDVRMTLQPTWPVVSAGDKVQFSAFFQQPENGLIWYDEPQPPRKTGKVTFRSGDTILGSATPEGSVGNEYVTFEVASLPLGTHIITAEFEGDQSYHPVTAEAATQRVIEETTTTRIAGTSTGGVPVPWNDPWQLNATVTSQLPGEISGYVRLFANGEWLYETNPIPAPEGSTTLRLDPGTYDIYAEYDGDQTHPPSRSATIRQVVTRATSTTSLNTSGDYLAAVGETPQFGVSMSPFGAGITGKVHLYDGATRLMTFDINGQQTFTMPALPVGVHYLRALFEGSAKWSPSESEVLRYTVVPQGFNIFANVAADAASISVNARYPSGPAPTAYKLYERVAGGAWAMVEFSDLPSFTRPSPQLGKVYAYRMEALDGAGALLGTSNTDTAVVALFTDDALYAGVPVKAAHLQELVTATNLLRAQGGLPAVSLADAARGRTIRKSHLDFLSNAIAEGRAACGAYAPQALSLPAGSVIRATHVLQLREALR
jgi:hypothetical protein